MTGKLAEKLPVTMSSLLNQLPDNLYPEEIPSALNLFSGSSDSVAHYNQMATGCAGERGTARFAPGSAFLLPHALRTRAGRTLYS
ncbi:Early growth response protein 3 [Microtus ochrogaster]|uniref:Early growth response protein 3 n=1 Tax=Microtus ochrogaster TaxID=79684 RepID=A0A8J6L3N0_MICOH|nr:Early growth response protein 3 [Microtus ochrogaster]